MNVTAIDAFCDADTQRAADCIEIRHWPDGIQEAVSASGAEAVLLGGGMESQCDIVSAIASFAAVLGPSSEQLKQLRDIRLWAHAVRCASEIVLPATYISQRGKPLGASSLSGEPHDYDRWLSKSLGGAGGLHVRDCTLAQGLTGLPEDVPAAQPDRIVQQRVPGRVIGVVWYVDGQRIELLGAVESLSSPFLDGYGLRAPLPYQYCGSWGPIPLSEMQLESLRRLAAELHRLTGCRGLLQADFVEDAGGRLFLLEVNPRWTAGMEIVEAGRGESLFPWALKPHGTASDSEEADCRSEMHRTAIVHPIRLHCAAKAIYYAPRAVCLTETAIRKLHEHIHDRFAWNPSSSDSCWFLSDLPSLGIARVPLEVGAPLLTIQARVSELDSDAAHTELLGLLTVGRDAVESILKQCG